MYNVQAYNTPNATAIAFQIAFDLYDNGTQEFLTKVIRAMPKKPEVEPAGKENENRT